MPRLFEGEAIGFVDEGNSSLPHGPAAGRVFFRRLGRRLIRAFHGCETNQPAALAAAHDCGRGVLHAGTAAHGAFDFPKLHAEAVHLDLTVAASHELKRSVRPVAAEVARAVEALSRDRMPEEGLLRQAGIIEIAPREAAARDIEVACDPVRAGTHVFVKHEVSLVAEGPAVGNAVPAFRN